MKFVGRHADYDHIDASTVASFYGLAMDIRPICSNDDHRASLEVIDRLWGPAVGSDGGDKPDILVALVDPYEEANFALPDPIRSIC